MADHSYCGKKYIPTEKISLRDHWGYRAGKRFIGIMADSHPTQSEKGKLSFKNGNTTWWVRAKAYPMSGWGYISQSYPISISNNTDIGASDFYISSDYTYARLTATAIGGHYFIGWYDAMTGGNLISSFNTFDLNYTNNLFNNNDKVLYARFG